MLPDLLRRRSFADAQDGWILSSRSAFPWHWTGVASPAHTRGAMFSFARLTRVLRRKPLLTALFFAATGSALAQAPAPAAPPITIGVSVIDNTRQPVPDLKQGDFSVTVDGKPAALSGFRSITAAQTPSYQEVIFVLDGVNLDYHGMAEARLQLSKYLRENAQLPMLSSILFVGDTEEQFAGQPTRDGKLLAQELDASASHLRVITRAAGIAGAGERVDTSLRSLESLIRNERTQPGRKLVVWLSGGWPFLAGPGIEFSNKQQQQQFATAIALTNGLREAGITLDSIDPRGALAAMGFQALYYQSYLKGVSRARDMQLANIGVQVLAVQSGGLVLNASNDIAAEIAQCLRERSSYYVLEIPAAAPSEQPVYHRVEVRVAQPGLTVHTNTGYYTGTD